MNIKKYIQSANSWKDLNETLESFTKSKQSKLAGDIFEYLTKLYLNLQSTLQGSIIKET